jgi:hypothetical protein
VASTAAHNATDVTINLRIQRPPHDRPDCPVLMAHCTIAIVPPQCGA